MENLGIYPTSFQNSLINNQMYFFAFQNSSQAMMLLNSRILECNKEMLKLLGTTPDQVIGKAPWDIIGTNQEAKQKARAMLQKVFTEKKVVSEIEFENFEGKKLPLRITLILLEHQNHKLLLSEWIDLTEQKQFEKRARQAQQESMMANHEVILSNLELERQKEEIIEQKNIIEAKNNAITASINYAARIQKSVLMPDDEIGKILPEYFMIFRPFSIVSGDFYWIQQTEHIIVVATADCTGHGIPGAFMSMLASSLLREVLGSYRNVAKMIAGEILDKLRDKVKSALRQTGKIEERKDGLDIALLLIDVMHKKVQFAGAYNPLWIVRDGELIVYKADPMPIAIFPKEKPFRNNIISLKNNDLLVICTDGFQDQFGGVAGEKKFGRQLLRQLLVTNIQKPLDEQKQILENALDKWMGTTPQTDDILLMAVKMNFEKMNYVKSAKDINWNHYNLLIAEDDDFSFIVLQSSLEITNISITRAYNGVQAFEHIKNNRVDILITDLAMPEMDGYELIRACKSWNKDMPIIVQTAYITEDKKLAFDAGCDDYINKPIKHRELIATISKFLIEN